MSIEHTDRWERVLLITACGAIREHRIPEADVGKDITVRILAERSFPAFGPEQPDRAVRTFDRVFRYEGRIDGPGPHQCVYHEAIW